MYCIFYTRKTVIETNFRFISSANVVGEMNEISILICTMHSVSWSGNETMRTESATTTETLISMIIENHINNKINNDGDDNEDDRNYSINNINKINVNIKDNNHVNKIINNITVNNMNII